MGMPVLIMGKSGSGKSCSLRNFPQCGVINVLGKPMPFRGTVNAVSTDDYNRIFAILQKSKAQSIAIDDAGYLMTNMFMRGHAAVGKGNDIFAFYNNVGDLYWNLIRFIAEKMPKDKIVYLMMHEDRSDFGDVKPKTIGKMLDEKACLEGMFAIVLRCREHKFFTQASEGDVAKTPMGMFEDLEIDNDLAMVDRAIRKFYPEYFGSPAPEAPEKKEETA